jgi:hypothetical protein
LTNMVPQRVRDLMKWSCQFPSRTAQMQETKGGSCLVSHAQVVDDVIDRYDGRTVWDFGRFCMHWLWVRC